VAEAAAERRMRWWGWGDPQHPPMLTAQALERLREMGIEPRPNPPVALQNVRLAASALPAAAVAQLRELVGEAGLSSAHADRVAHAAGRGYPDLVRLRRGEPDAAPDAVVRPTGHAQLRGVLEVCAQHSIAVVPFGGGTSVVGGVAPLRDGRDAVIALDMGRLALLLDLDLTSLTATVQGGMRAAALERELQRHGLTLGHFPQSFEYVSLGGCVATRSAGQASSGYGAIAKMVLGLRLVAPATDIELPATPATAAGPGLRELLVGSEGALGVIERVALRLRRAPAESIYRAAFFRDFAAGVQTLRSLAQRHAMPDLARLSDRPETEVSLALAQSGSIAEQVGRRFLDLRGYGDGCLAIFGFEGPRGEAAQRYARARALIGAGGGLMVGESPARAWRRTRFTAPYLRDELLSNGIMVETLETAAQWSRLLDLHGEVATAIAGALNGCGTPGVVMCHVSHLYETGASLYFTFIAAQLAGEELAQWQAVKRAASEAIVHGGATITHHHAVGRDHAAWMRQEVGDGGRRVLRALKAELDPRGIMNPGKLAL
jgi:alkyldihydroxyacetonephosphate synthase